MLPASLQTTAANSRILYQKQLHFRDEHIYTYIHILYSALGNNALVCKWDTVSVFSYQSLKWQHVATM